MMTKLNINKYDVSRLWKVLRGLPGGKWVFSKGLGLVVPYTGSIKPQVLALENGFCQISLKKHRGICNHIGTVHAAAISNLVELAGGLALISRDDSPKCIVSNLSVSFIKPATTDLLASCEVVGDLKKYTKGKVLVKNEQQQVVAKGICEWRVWI